MKLSCEEVKHIALLARLALPEHDEDRMREQVSNILDNMDVLKEVDTTDVSATAQSIALENVYREDEPRPSCHPELVLSNAPEREDSSFKTRAVLE